MKNTREFFDLGISVDKLIENSVISDLFYLKDLQSRRLYLDSEVTQDTVGELVKNIIRYNKDDEDMSIPVENRTPIYLYIASDGGDEVSGFELIDVIMASKTPVYTVNIANAYSMSFLICLAGDKRFGLPSSTFLLHDGSSCVYASTAKAQDRFAFNQKLEERVKSFVISRSNLDEHEYDEKFRYEWYMFSDEALGKGFIDEIITEI